MPLHRGSGGPPSPEPVGPRSGTFEERRSADATQMARGSLSCPRCDAPPAPPRTALTPASALGCGWCGHEGAVRDFLSLADPGRPTRVAVHVRAPAAARR